MIEHRIEHSLGVEGARALMETAVERYGVEIPKAKPSLRWTGDGVGQLSGKIGGWSLAARVEVSEGALTLAFTLPGDGSIPEAMAHRRIEEEAARWLVTARA